MRTLQPRRTKDEVEIREFLGAVRRYWPWLAVPLVLAIGLTIFLTFRAESEYEARARVQVVESAAQEATIGVLNEVDAVRSRVLANEIGLAESDAAHELVRERLSLGPDDDLPQGSITAEFESDILNFSYLGKTPEEAARNANVWTEAYMDLRRSEDRASIAAAAASVETRLEELREDRAEIEADLVNLQARLASQSDEAARAAIRREIEREQSSIAGDLSVIDAEINTTIINISRLQLNEELEARGTIRLLQRAVPPTSTTSRPLSRNLVVGILLAGILGGGLVTLQHRLDQSVSTPEDVRKHGLTALGTIPRSSRSPKRFESALEAKNHPDRSVVEAYQIVRSALQFSAAENGAKVIVVTSPSQGDGKTTTAANLAMAFASSGRKVVLVDTNLRSPQIHSLFDSPLIPGFSDALAGNAPLADVIVQSSRLPGVLSVVPAGTEPSNPAAFLASASLENVLAPLRSQYDIVLLDTAAVLPFADVLSLCSADRGVVLVTSTSTTNEDEMFNAINSIERSGGTLLGVVLNSPTGHSLSERIEART